jgi:hypothetical protein
VDVDGWAWQASCTPLELAVTARDKLAEALGQLRFGIDLGRRYGLSGREVEEATEQLLPFVQAQTDRYEQALRRIAAACSLRCTLEDCPSVVARRALEAPDA